MRSRKERSWRPKTIGLLTAVAVIVLSFPYSAQAGGGWWKKGLDILKIFQKDNQELTIGQIGSGLKEALQIGADNVVAQLGQTDGFNGDSTIKIPLPGKLVNVQEMLTKVGMGGLLDDLELKLNRAAEIATPKAKDLFRQAILDMTFDDIQGIYKGSDDAATIYFREKMSPVLAAEMRPIIENSLAEIGAVNAYSKVMDKCRSLPFVPDVKADMADHVIQKGMDGIFHYLAAEEKAIRQDPAKRTTELLKRVFSTKLESAISE